MPDTDTIGGSQQIIRRFLAHLSAGKDWAQVLMEAVALWTIPEEVYQERHFRYLIQGEAFDWLLLAERLCLETNGIIPENEWERLVFYGQLPAHITEKDFKDMLGNPKYGAHLNYWYGVVVEEALQFAVESEVRKEKHSNSFMDEDNVDDQVCQRLYSSSREVLLIQFRTEYQQRPHKSITLAEIKEFTYWLFKRRLHLLDRARIASDTRKGLLQLQWLQQMPQPNSNLSGHVIPVHVTGQRMRNSSSHHSGTITQTGH